MEFPESPEEKIFREEVNDGINGSKRRALIFGYPIMIADSRTNIPYYLSGRSGHGNVRKNQEVINPQKLRITSSVPPSPRNVFRDKSLYVRLSGVIIVAIIAYLVEPTISSPQCQWSFHQEVERLSCQIPVGSRLSVEDEIHGVRLERAKSLWVSCGGDYDNLLSGADEGIFSNANEGDFSLGREVFQSMPNLKDVKLEYCKISRFSSEGLNLPHLQNLTIRTHTNFSWSDGASAGGLEVETSFFRGLYQLRHLDLSTTSQLSLPSDFLCFLPSLQTLNLSSCWLSDLRAFVPSDPLNTQNCDNQLRVLDLSRNHLTLLPPATFTSLSKLEVLKVPGNAITIISEMSLLSLFNLRVISLSGNQLTSLPPNLFKENKGLKEIYLGHNKISVLGPGIFANLKSLVILDLSYNELTSQWVNSETFVGLYSLFSLNLSFNDLSKLDGSLFRDLHFLQLLNLQDNQIEFIDDNVFSSMPNLYTLVLSHNRLKKIDSWICTGLPSLSFLSLDNNQIQVVTSESFINCSLSLEDVNLSSNKITTVPIALRVLTNLRTLDLGENNITNVGNASYQSLPNLYGLRLTGNSISFIPKESFHHLASLKIVNLAKNNVARLEPGVFDNNPNLQAVRLDSNKIQDIKGIFKNIPNLLWLNISANQLEQLRYEEFPPRLQWLDLRSNKIHTVHPSEETLRIRNLDLSDNKITELGSASIPDSIENLILSHNSIRTVQQYTFYRKPNLTRVILSHNQLQQLDQNALRLGPDRVPFTDMFLGHNPLQCDCSMEWLQNINSEETLGQYPVIQDIGDIKCSLTFDRFSAEPTSYLNVDTHQFLCKYDSHCFNTCQCCDYDACDCKMTCPQNCSCYHDQSWAANVVDCSNLEQDLIPSRIPMDATQLFLDGNVLPSLQSHAFLGRRNLQGLYLNASHIELIENKSLSGLTSLKILHLENNFLKRLEGHEFEGLDVLEELYLSGNSLSWIATETFASLSLLRVLHLHSNNIVDFEVWQVISGVGHLSEVTLSGNEFSCECSFATRLTHWMLHSSIITDKNQVQCVDQVSTSSSSSSLSGAVQEEQKTELLVVRLIDQKNPKCISSASHPTDLSILERTTTIITLRSDPAAKKDNHLDNLGVSRFLPFSWILCVIIPCVIFVSIVLSFVTWRSRESLKIFAHSKCGLRLGCCCCAKNSSGERDDNKLFHAFISYSSKDEHWVTLLASELEKDYRVCLMHRDLPTGATPYLADTIVQASHASQRTILVLSHHFLKGEWTRTDVKSAHQSVLKDRSRKVIIISLGDLPTRDLDPDIRQYMPHHISCGDKNFWEKLRYALPDVKGKVRGSCPGSTMNLPQKAHLASPVTAPPSPPARLISPAYQQVQYPPEIRGAGHVYSQPSPSLGNTHNLQHLGQHTQNNMISPMITYPTPAPSGIVVNLPPNITNGGFTSHHPHYQSVTTVLSSAKMAGSNASINVTTNGNGSLQRYSSVGNGAYSKRRNTKVDL